MHTTRPIWTSFQQRLHSTYTRVANSYKPQSTRQRNSFFPGRAENGHWILWRRMARSLPVGGVVDSLLPPGVRSNSYSESEGSIVFENVNIGRHCRIGRTIIEANVDVPGNAELAWISKSIASPVIS